METTKQDLEILFEKTADYVETKANLLKLQAVDKTADVVSSLVLILIAAVIFSVVFFILNIGLALWIGYLLGKTFYGFFILAGFYTIVGLSIYFLKGKFLKANLSNLIIKKLLN
ncbi:MAG TPA: hypothetical protein VK559_13515 [Ferruginibacter sp.]|nr:hypothetical protein [Ferruginibacter sp.]